MIHKMVLSENTGRDLEILNNSNILNDFYLAGGTGCAMQMGHRISYDLDFFCNEEIDMDELYRKLVDLGDFKVDLSNSNTLTGTFNNTRISFMLYDYVLISDFKLYRDINIASLMDIGCMKMDAITSRGTKRDFVDLYYILQEKNLSLEDMYDFYREKYEGKNYNETHLFKSLTYFDDAEKDPDPKMLVEFDWENVKDYFIKNRLELDKGHDFEMEF